MKAGEIWFYFLLYSLLGWLLENGHSFFTRGEFWKEGFLKGPFKPMYGVAPLLLLMLCREGSSPVLVALLCLLVPTVVEGVSGYLLHTLFGRKFWDYSANRGQLGGYVCLRYSLYWGVLSLLVLNVLHPLAVLAYRSLAPVWHVAGPVFLLLFAADLLWTCLIRRRAWRGSLI